MYSIRLTFRVLIFLFIMLLLVASPVLAVLYSTKYTVLEEDGTDNGMIAVSTTANIDWMIDNGFMQSDALDTRVETLGGTEMPWMVSEDKIHTALTVNGLTETNLYFTSGNSDATAMDIIVDDGGYITRADDADWELADDFEIEISGYFNTEANYNKPLVYKKGAFAILVDTITDGTIRSYFLDTESTDGTGGSTSYYDLYTGNVTRAGNKTANFTGLITAAKMKLYKTGAPTGTLTVNIRDQADDSIIGTLGTIDVSTLGGAAADYTFDDAIILVPSLTNIRMLAEYSGGDAANYVHVCGAAGTEGTYYDGSYHNDAAHEMGVLYYYDLLVEASAAGVTSGDYVLTVGIVGTDMKIYIDAVEKDSAALGGLSVNDNANSWYLYPDPYWSYYTHTVNSVLIGHYEPNDIIAGTVLPDREGVAENGVITWGSNPAGVTITLGNMESESQPAIVDTEEDIPTGYMSKSEVSDWYGDHTVGVTLQGNPFRPFVQILSDNTDLSEIQSWRLLALALVLLITVGSIVAVRGHLAVAGIASGITVGAMCGFGIFPLWALVFAIAAVLLGLVSERSPYL
jgi:hypothetical protein